MKAIASEIKASGDLKVKGAAAAALRDGCGFGEGDHGRCRWFQVDEVWILLDWCATVRREVCQVLCIFTMDYGPMADCYPPSQCIVSMNPNQQ